MNWFTDIQNLWVVPFYPLAAFLMIALGRAMSKGTGIFANKSVCSFLTIFATLLGLLHTVFGAIPWLLHQPGNAVVPFERNYLWLEAGSLKLSLGYLVDSMSVMMLFVVTFISLFIQVYTHGYMKHDDGYAKFFGYLALFNFSMLGLVLSTNLFQIYVFWELVGVSSYLLIGFWFKKPDAAKASMKAFMMNRVGDFGFLFGILSVLFFSYNQWAGYLAKAGHETMAMLSFRALPDMVVPIMTQVTHFCGGDLGAATWLFALIAFLLFMGPMAKSAQVPLHTWLPDAMAGPTPISALIHAATMVAAGVYLVGRIYPIFWASSVAMTLVAIIGTLTAIIGATIALTQYDIKKALAYSTMSQLGFMVAGMGVGAFTAGLFHLFTHAFFKAMLFLCSGSVIHACEDEQDMRKMGGLFFKLPVTAVAYLIGCFAISGLLWMSGFWSKDLILASALGAKDHVHINFDWVYWALAITAGGTSFYMFRTFFLTFCGKYRGEAHIHHEDWWMTLPLIVLAIPSAFIGLLMAGLVDVHGILPAFSDYVHFTLPQSLMHPLPVVHEHPETFMEAISNPVGLTSAVLGWLGFGLAGVFYWAKPAIPAAIKKMPVVSDLFSLFSNKWYFDDIYAGFVDYIYLAFARASASFDRHGVDGLVNLTGRSVMSTGNGLKALQSGKVQTYIAIMFFSVVALSLLLYYWLM